MANEVHLFPELLEGELVARYARFLADVRLKNGRVVRAHCVNSGRMEGLVRPGARVWLSRAASKTRKLRYTWELIEEPNATNSAERLLVGANTALPNRLVGTLLTERRIAGFEDVTSIRPEQPYGRGHRIDFLLERRDGKSPPTPHYVEVKNCHLVYPDGCAYFPDSTSERATRHVHALTRLAKRGILATVIFTVQRSDGRFVRPSQHHDPAFARALRQATRSGVTVRALSFDVSLRGLTYLGELPVDVERYDTRTLLPWALALKSTSGWKSRVPR